LKWNPPLDDGGAPIDHYLVEKLDTETGRWMPALKTKDPKAEIDNLVPGHEYKFRVSAVNNEGASEPLDAEHAIIAKNPFGKFFDITQISSTYTKTLTKNDLFKNRRINPWVL
jgi:hypothetical protein